MTPYLASTVLAAAAADLNDPSQAIFTNAVLLPHLKAAGRELRNQFLLNGVPYVRRTDITAHTVLAAVAGFDNTALTTLLTGWMEPVALYERAVGEDAYSWREMTRQSFLTPRVAESFRRIWALEGISILMPAATQTLEMRFDYIKDVTVIASASDSIDIIAGELFLQKKTAALAAMYIGENETRASVLQDEAASELATTIAINLKGEQGIAVRRKGYQNVYVRSNFNSRY